MKPEAQFLAALARGDHEGLAEALSNPIDAQRVAAVAYSNGIDALCFWMWREMIGPGRFHLPPGLDEVLGRRFREAYLHQQLRNRSLARDIRDVSNALRECGIRGLYAKGPWVVFRAYPDPGTRRVSDIDLCVRERDYRGAVDALRRLGYAPTGQLPDSADEAMRRSHHSGQIRFDARGRRRVELHFRLVNVGPPAADESWIWSSTREFEVEGSLIDVPGPEAMLLHLLLHAGQHAYAGLRFLLDIRWALDHEVAVPESSLFATHVRDLRCAALVYHGLLLARELAGAPVEDDTLKRFRPSRMRQAVFRRVWRLDSVRNLEAKARSGAVESPLLYLLEMGRLRDKARYAAGILGEAGRALFGLRSAEPAPAPGAQLSEAERTKPVTGRPGLRAGLLHRRMNDLCAVYNPVADRTTFLNVTAGAVLALCDGTRTPEAIAAQLATEFQGDQRRILGDVSRILEDLAARGFLVET